MLLTSQKQDREIGEFVAELLEEAGLSVSPGLAHYLSAIDYGEVIAFILGTLDAPKLKELVSDVEEILSENRVQT